MRLGQVILVSTVAIGALVQCAAETSSEDDEESRIEQAAACSSAFSPTWRQGSGANEWWVEYAITMPSGSSGT